MSGGANQGYSPVNDYIPDSVEHRRQLARKANELTQGNLNCSFDVTLTNGGTTTTLTDPRIFPTKTLIPMALTANAAMLLTSGIWFDTFLKGSCVAHHASAAHSDLNVRMMVIG